MKMQSSLNQSCVDCFVAHCHKCSFQPANILVFTSSLNGMCCWAAKKMHYNINIRNLISRINQFSIYVLKAVLSIFALLIKCFFFLCMYVCVSYMFNIFNVSNFCQKIQLLGKIIGYKIRSLYDFVWTVLLGKVP